MFTYVSVARRKRMKKRILFALSLCVLAFCLVVACKDSGSGGDKRHAELRLNYLMPYYLKGSTKADLVGTLIYTDVNGAITTVDIKDDGVTTDFSADAAAENKVLKISYQGIYCAGTYNIVDLADVTVGGCYIIGRDKTYDFYDTRKVLVTTYESWGDFMDFSSGAMEDKTYSLGISGTTGETLLKVEGDETYYSPDGNGGLEGYPSEEDLPEPKIGRWYVSITKEPDYSSRINAHAKGNYLAVRFTLGGDMKMWFTDDISDANLEALRAADSPDVTIPAAKVEFDNHGVRIFKVTIEDKKDWASNLSMFSRNSDFNDSFTVVSYDNGTYYGYSYSMKIGPEDP